MKIKINEVIKGKLSKEEQSLFDKNMLGFKAIFFEENGVFTNNHPAKEIDSINIIQVDILPSDYIGYFFTSKKTSKELVEEYSKKPMLWIGISAYLSQYKDIDFDTFQTEPIKSLERPKKKRT